MGHESQIEPWLAHDQRSACWFHKSLASSQIEYENHRGRTHKRYAIVRSVPSLWSEMREQSCSIPRGLKINKNSAEGEVFLVDFPSYRTLRKPRNLPTRDRSACRPHCSKVDERVGSPTQADDYWGSGHIQPKTSVSV